MLREGLRVKLTADVSWTATGNIPVGSIGTVTRKELLLSGSLMLVVVWDGIVSEMETTHSGTLFCGIGNGSAIPDFLEIIDAENR